MKTFLLLSALVAMLITPEFASAGAGPSYGESAYYPRLDAWPETQYEFGVTVVPKTSLEGDLGDSSQTEIDADWRLFQSDQFLMGMIEMGLVFDLVTFGDSTSINIPDQLLTLGAEITATWRYTGDYALQFGIRPGLFTEIEAIGTDSVFFPFSGYFLKRLSPEMSGIVGIEIRPGFELGVLPTIGIDWDISDTMLLRFAVPESRFDIVLTDALDGFFQVAWENTSYKVDEDALFSRDTMTLEDLNLALGLTLELDNGLELGTEVGARVGRGIEFEVFGPEGVNDIDVDGSIYTRFFARRSF